VRVSILFCGFGHLRDRNESLTMISEWRNGYGMYADLRSRAACARRCGCDSNIGTGVFPGEFGPRVPWLRW
jgi:hypothetical protein